MNIFLKMSKYISQKIQIVFPRIPKSIWAIFQLAINWTHISLILSKSIWRINSTHISLFIFWHQVQHSRELRWKITLLWVFNVCNISSNFETEFRHKMSTMSNSDFHFFSLHSWWVFVLLSQVYVKVQQYNFGSWILYFMFLRVNERLIMLLFPSLRKSLTIKCWMLKFYILRFSVN